MISVCRSLMLCLVALLVMAGCSSKKTDSTIDKIVLPYDLKERYVATSSLLEEVPPTLKSFQITASENDLQLLVDQYDGLDFSYNAAGLSDDARKLCAQHKYRVDSLRQVVRGVLNENLRDVRRTLLEEDDLQFVDEVEYAFYVPKGTRIYVDYTIGTAASGRLYNKSSRANLRSWNRKKNVHDNVVANASGVYVWSLKLKGDQTVSVEITKNLISIDELDKHYDVSDDDK
jgi:hypothetical protein